MKRSTFVAVTALVISLTTTSAAKACCYVPWLDPLAWLGFYGCGYGCCGHGGHGYRAPYSYAPPMYSAYAPASAYRTAAGPGCGCNGAVPAPTVSALPVPMGAYRPATQYVPRTSYYSPQQIGAVQSYPPVAGGAMPVQPSIQQTNVAVLPPGSSQYGTPQPVPATQGYPVPGALNTPPAAGQYTPGITTPVPAGDIYGDHEVPVQSSLPVIRSSYSTQAPLRRVSYGVTPRPARSFRNIAR